MNKVENIVVGTVKDTFPATSQIRLEDVGVDRAEMGVAIYGKNYPSVGDRVAVSTLGEWIDADHFVNVVVAVADMIDKLDSVSDETQSRLVNMVLRLQMDAARQERQKGQI